VSAGIGTFDDTERAFVDTCTAMQGDITVQFDDASYLDLTEVLNGSGVCPGDVSLVALG
jgi:hypothetical protein